MAQSAGGVNIVLNLNSASYSKGLTQAQREMDKFVNGTKTGMHSTVTSVQAASGAIRTLEGNITNNVRAVERFVTMIPGVGKALQMAFPLIGGIAFGGMVFELGNKVVAFIDKANKMPAAIKQGFESLHLAAMASNDALKLTDDLLQNHINKLQGKTQNNLAIQLDEARIKADDLAKSLENDASKVKALLAENQLSALMGLVTGKAGTSSVAGTVNYGLQEIQHLAYLNRQATGTPGAAQAAKNLADKQAYYAGWAKTQLFLRDNPQYADDSIQDMAGDQSANRNILLGFQDVLNDQQADQAEKNRNAQLVPQGKAAEAASEAAKKATESRKKAAEELRQSWERNLEVLKKFDEYEQNIANVTSQYNNEFFKTNGLSPADSRSLSDQGKAASDYIQSLRASIDLNKQNATAIAESSVQMALITGQMTKLDAAQVLSILHMQDYADALKKLTDERDAISTSAQYNNSPLARQAALQDNANRIASLNTSRGIQAAQDAQLTSPTGTSGVVGAADALNDFVIASRDAATQMRDLTINILGGLNQQIVAAMSGQRTNFGNFGAGIFRSLASTGLQKAEGGLLGAIGSKLGTRANPIYTIAADGSSIAKSAAGFLSGLFGGGRGPGQSGLNTALGIASSGGGISTIASSLTDMIPFLAGGGPINGPAIVGEQGPELFVPSSSGTIIPNHQLTGSGGHVFNIDATGSTDPAQVEAAVQRGIRAAAPHIMAGSVRAVSERSKRTPPTKRN